MAHAHETYEQAYEKALEALAEAAERLQSLIDDGGLPLDMLPGVEADLQAVLACAERLQGGQLADALAAPQAVSEEVEIEQWISTGYASVDLGQASATPRILGRWPGEDDPPEACQ